MNERIREVWIKAASKDSDPDNWDTQEQFIERFAELIVKECADHIMNSTDRYRKEYFANMIKEHFGVEE
jgi:hypothetical protein